VKKHYTKSRDSLIHLVNPYGGEHTLCGDAFDIDNGDEQHAWEDVKSGPVTCENCARVIEECRGVRIRISKEGK